MSVSIPTTAESPKRRLPIWFVILIVVMLGMTIFGDRGILHIWRANQQKAALEQQVLALEKVNAELRLEIDSLNNDLQTIESLARRELGMVRDDEQVYQFPPDEQHYKSTSPDTADSSQLK